MNTTAENISSSISWRLRTSDPQLVLEYLLGLTHSQHREACRVLAEEARLLSRGDYWTLTLALVCHDSKAYLGTMLKAAPSIDWNPVNSVTAGLGCREAEAFLDFLVTEGTDIDVQKTVAAVLPLQTSPEDVEQLLNMLNIVDTQRRTMLLLAHLTQPTAYVLFKIMRQMESERQWMLSLCRRLIRTNTSLGWNLASLAKVYFDLTELQGTFSLKLEPYQLSHIETSYDAFAQIMN